MLAELPCLSPEPPVDLTSVCLKSSSGYDTAGGLLLLVIQAPHCGSPLGSPIGTLRAAEEFIRKLSERPGTLNLELEGAH